jgi:hypothetical protein
MTLPADRLLQFVIVHEGCGRELEVGRTDHVDEPTEIVLRCPGCCASLAIRASSAEAESLIQITEGEHTDADIVRALVNLRKH